VAAGSPPSSETAFVVGGDITPRDVLASVQALFRTRLRRIPRRRYTEMDTVDGRVRRVGARLTIARGRGGATITWQPPEVAPRLSGPVDPTARFAWDLPEGALRLGVSAVAGVRALLPLAEAEEAGSALDVLDERGKTVARLRLESARVRPPRPRQPWRELPAIVTVVTLRGYEEDGRRLRSVVESRPGLEPCEGGLRGEMLRALGVGPPIHLSMPRVELAPDVRADDGARAIHRAILDLIERNEPGVRADLDTEFLHDFRVEIRRTRSLLGQVRRVFAPEATSHFSSEFSWLARTTSPARDMDVLMLTIRERAPEIPAADVEALLSFVAEGRQREHQGLTAALDSPRYQRLVREWRDFLERPPQPAEMPADAGRRLCDVVVRRARRLARRMARAAGSVGAHADATRLHEIRIDAKKLRYLLDVTAAFYDADALARILARLRKLQRVLGEFNDAHLQEARLVECGHALAAAGGPPGAVLALGRLAEGCRHRQERLREPVADALRRFRGKGMRAARRRAFRRGGDADGSS